MKEKILKSDFCRFLSNMKVVKYFSNHPLFSKFCNYEVIMYILCGVATTVVNYVVYFIIPLGTDGTSVVIKTVVSWIVAVTFAFVVNKVFAFDSPSWDKKVVVKEFIPFLIARLLSLGFDALFMYVTVGLLQLNEPIFKILSNVFVMIANYFASKFIVFKKKDETT